MIDVIKIYGVFPLLVPETVIQKRIKFYHEYDILVSTGSTVTQYAIMENSFERYVTEAAKVGFDIIEIGDATYVWIIQHGWIHKGSSAGGGGSSDNGNGW